MSVQFRSEDTLIRLNLIKDCPVVQDDEKLAKDMFVHNIAIPLKGKSTRKKPKPVIHDTIAVPKALMLLLKDYRRNLKGFTVECDVKH
jgi:hypothetical protein